LISLFIKKKEDYLTASFKSILTLINSFKVSSVAVGIVAETKTSWTAGGALCSRSLIG
jgi:hypothetical protein